MINGDLSTSGIDVPIFFLNSKEEARDFYKNNKLKVALLSFNAIKVAMTNDLIEIPVLKFNANNIIIVISLYRKEFDKILRSCIKVFEEFEEFEKCTEALNIINTD